MARTASFLDIDRQILGDAFTSNEPQENLVELCDKIGVRMGGTPGERQAADFVRRRLKRYGLSNVRAERFPYNGWRRGDPARLSLVKPVQHHFPCISLPYCPATGPKGLTAEMIDLGDGAPEDFERLSREIRGRIVFVSSRIPPQVRRWVHRGEKYGRSVRAGAVGFLFVNHYDGLLPATGCLRFNRPAEIPGLGLAKETGLELLRRAGGTRPVVRIVTSDVNKPMVSRNIVAELVGTRWLDELVLIGAHYDSHDLCPAADDNASGVTVLLETARLLAPHRKHLKRTVRFVAFGEEEFGLIGAYHHVKAHRSEMARVRLMLNADGLTTARPKGLIFHGVPEARDYLEKLAKDMRTAIPFCNNVTAYSDHFPFVLQGVPAATLGNMDSPFAGRGYGHTHADTTDKVALIDQREAAALLARVALRVANDDALPLRHRSPGEVKALLEAESILEVLDIEGANPFAER